MIINILKILMAFLAVFVVTALLIELITLRILCVFASLRL
jgi:hypothetical protein